MLRAVAISLVFHLAVYLTLFDTEQYGTVAYSNANRQQTLNILLKNSLPDANVVNGGQQVLLGGASRKRGYKHASFRFQPLPVVRTGAAANEERSNTHPKVKQGTGQIATSGLPEDVEKQYRIAIAREIRTIRCTLDAQLPAEGSWKVRLSVQLGGLSGKGKIYLEQSSGNAVMDDFAKNILEIAISKARLPAEAQSGNYRMSIVLESGESD